MRYLVVIITTVLLFSCTNNLEPDVKYTGQYNNFDGNRIMYIGHKNTYIVKANIPILQYLDTKKTQYITFYGMIKDKHIIINKIDGL